MEFLHSNYPPVKTGSRTFLDAFKDLIPRSTSMDIAVGYITSDSRAELQKFVEFNENLKRVNLTIGMQYLDRFTKVEYNTAIRLNDYLRQNDRGEVRLVNLFRYHGKLYSFSNSGGPYAGIIGSNNLSSIIDGGARVYESAVLLDDRDAAVQIHDFISTLVNKATENIADFSIDSFNTVNHVMDDQEGVKRAPQKEYIQCLENLTVVKFEIPIKGAEDSPQSNLNVYFGEGRKNATTGLVRPRHWYEVELIVPVTITKQHGYPQAGTPEAKFTVVTDDHWTFKCKISGTNSKNFRSEGDLKILGKWIKGRMEADGALQVGEPVTRETLRRYGRSSFSLVKTKIKDLWYLDFGKETAR